MFQCTHLNDAGNAGCPKKVQEEFLFFHYTEHWTLHTEHWTLRCASKQTRLSLSMFALVLTSRSVDFDVDNYVDKEKLLSWWCLSGPMFSAWLTPPIVPHLSVYVFNITNPEEVGRHYLHHHHHQQHDNHKKKTEVAKIINNTWMHPRWCKSIYFSVITDRSIICRRKSQSKASFRIPPSAWVTSGPRIFSLQIFSPQLWR